MRLNISYSVPSLLLLSIALCFQMRATQKTAEREEEEEVWFVWMKLVRKWIECIYVMTASSVLHSTRIWISIRWECSSPSNRRVIIRCWIQIIMSSALIFLCVCNEWRLCDPVLCSPGCAWYAEESFVTTNYYYSCFNLFHSKLRNSHWIGINSYALANFCQFKIHMEIDLFDVHSLLPHSKRFPSFFFVDFEFHLDSIVHLEEEGEEHKTCRWTFSIVTSPRACDKRSPLTANCVHHFHLYSDVRVYIITPQWHPAAVALLSTVIIRRYAMYALRALWHRLTHMRGYASIRFLFKNRFASIFVWCLAAPFMTLRLHHRTHTTSVWSLQHASNRTSPKFLSRRPLVSPERSKTEMTQHIVIANNIGSFRVPNRLPPQKKNSFKFTHLQSVHAHYHRHCHRHCSREYILKRDVCECRAVW